MIKPVQTGEREKALDSASQLRYECEECGFRGAFHLVSPINLNSSGNSESPLEGYYCENCGLALKY